MMAEGDTPHLACPFEDCGSSDAFNWNDDGYGYCHSCGNSYPSLEPTFDWAKDQYPVKERINIMDIPVKSGTYEGIRGIKPDVCQLYGIQLQLGEDGKPIRYAYKYPHTTKYRSYDDKSKTWVKDTGLGMVHLFGPEFNAGTSKRLYLTEGEFDAASLYEILGEKFPVKSIPSASIGEKFLQKNYEYLNSFESVIYAGELDAAGKSAADKIYSAIPEKFFYVPMSKHKDANDFLTAGDGKELMWAAMKPQKYSPDNFFISDADVERAIRNENPYEYTPHLGCNVRTNDDAQANNVSMEEIIRAGQIAADTENNRTILFEMRSHDDPLKLLDHTRTAATVFGADYVFVDHVQRLAYLSNSGVDGATSTLTTLGSRMAQLSKELNIGVIFISQVNDDGRTKYAASLEEEAIICIKIERDVESEDEILQNTTNFIVDKNRPFARLGNAGSVYYDPETTILTEDVPYVQGDMAA
jgi:twinkle protein